MMSVREIVSSSKNWGLGIGCPLNLYYPLKTKKGKKGPRISPIKKLEIAQRLNTKYF